MRRRKQRTAQVLFWHRQWFRDFHEHGKELKPLLQCFRLRKRGRVLQESHPAMGRLTRLAGEIALERWSRYFNRTVEATDPIGQLEGPPGSGKLFIKGPAVTVVFGKEEA